MATAGDNATAASHGQKEAVEMMLSISNTIPRTDDSKTETQSKEHVQSPSMERKDEDNADIDSPMIDAVKKAIETLKEEKPKKVPILNKCGDKIIDYFRTSGIDKERIFTMTNKDLSVPLADYCGDKKVKGLSGALLKNLKSQMEEKKKEEPTVKDKEEHTECVKTLPSKPTVAKGSASENEDDGDNPDAPDESLEPEDEDKYKIKRIGSDEVQNFYCFLSLKSQWFIHLYLKHTE